MNVEARIQSIELKTVALRKAAEKLDMELAEVKKQASKPVPTNHKKKRLQKFADFYVKKGIV